ncbi:MAG: DUF3079 domain-containing protein [Vicinamibacterales bacterium]
MKTERGKVDAPAMLNPPHPERVCWGCDRYCPAEDLACGNGAIRTPHPKELFGQEWLDWAERTTASRPPRD